MNLIASMAGIAITNGANNTVYWLKNETGTNYTDVGQRWVSDDTYVVVTSNRLNVTGYNKTTKINSAYGKGPDNTVATIQSALLAERLAMA